MVLFFRNMQALSSSRPSAKQNGPTFSFKSDERAERRKEARNHPCFILGVSPKSYGRMKLNLFCAFKFISVLHEAGGEDACQGS